MKETFDFGVLVDLCRRTHEQMQSSAARAANTALAARNWLFGWYIVEFEQDGDDRAEYGAELLKRLSQSLTSTIGRGCSVDSLEQMRRFYRVFPGLLPFGEKSETPSRILAAGISETLSRIFAPQPAPSIEAAPAPNALARNRQPIRQTLSVDLAGTLRLGWSHYVALLTIDNADERKFYEIEAARNGWGVRELKRQIASSLYERLALSRDKDEIRRMAREGQVVEKAADLIKDLLDDELPTVGIVLCHRKNDSLVELTLPKDTHFFASKYQLYLPSKAELKRQLELAQADLEDSRG